MAPTRGFYCMARGWMDNPAFASQPYTEREAWVWLIEGAAYQAETQRVGAVAVAVDRGEVIASVRYLAKAWTWEATKVWRYLRKLTENEMIMVRSATASATALRVIRLCKYNDYQFASGEAATASATPPQQQVQQPNATAHLPLEGGAQRENPRGVPSGATAKCNSKRNENRKKANKGSSAKIETDTPSGAKVAREMVAAFVSVRSEIFGAVKGDEGTRTDYVIATELAVAGLPLDAFKALLESQMPGLKARGCRPRSLAMFKPDMLARAAEAQRAAQEPMVDPVRDYWSAAITYFKSSGGKWHSSFDGTAPGQAGCTMPQRLQAECLGAIHGRAAA